LVDFASQNLDVAAAQLAIVYGAYSTAFNALMDVPFIGGLLKKLPFVE
jgi:hypothetical protein